MDLLATQRDFAPGRSLDRRKSNIPEIIAKYRLKEEGPLDITTPSKPRGLHLAGTPCRRQGRFDEDQLHPHRFRPNRALTNRVRSGLIDASVVMTIFPLRNSSLR